MDTRCNVTLSDDADTPITIMRQWFGPSLHTNGSDYTITGDTLHINQLSVARDNNRNITCLVTVIPSAGYPYVLQSSGGGSTQLSVAGELESTWLSSILVYLSYFNVTVAIRNDLFVPDIIIPGAPTAGDKFNITCRLDGVVERLVGTPTVLLSFLSPPGGVTGIQFQDGLAYSRSHSFKPGMTDDVGNYTCAASVFLSLGLFGSTSSRILQIQST